MSVRMAVLLLVFGAVGCADDTIGAERLGKPVAPVEVRLEARGHEVTMVATPKVDVPALELTVDGRSARFGETAAGVSRRVVVVVTGDGEVVGVARVGGRTRAAVVRVGAPRTAATAPVVRVVELPGHGRVAEVRP